jgi:hypothetical protein
MQHVTHNHTGSALACCQACGRKSFTLMPQMAASRLSHARHRYKISSSTLHHSLPPPSLLPSHFCASHPKNRRKQPLLRMNTRQVSQVAHCFFHRHERMQGPCLQKEFKSPLFSAFSSRGRHPSYHGSCTCKPPPAPTRWPFGVCAPLRLIRLNTSSHSSVLIPHTKMTQTR